MNSIILENQKLRRICESQIFYHQIYEKKGEVNPNDNILKKIRNRRCFSEVHNEENELEEKKNSTISKLTKSKEDALQNGLGSNNQKELLHLSNSLDMNDLDEILEKMNELFNSKNDNLEE